MHDVRLEVRDEPASPERFAGPGCQLPPGGGRTAANAYAGLEVGILPPPGPPGGLGGGVGGERSEPAVAAGALLEKVGGGCRGSTPRHSVRLRFSRCGRNGARGSLARARWRHARLRLIGPAALVRLMPD